MDIRKLYEKYKDVILYLFFGICTTAVNIVVYWWMSHTLSAGVMSSTVIAWVAAVLFAYLTNRKWVFHSKAEASDEIAKEIGSFFACRLTTGIVDWFCMFLFVEIMGLNDVIVKFMANVLVIILNYIASKLVIFKK